MIGERIANGPTTSPGISRWSGSVAQSTRSADGNGTPPTSRAPGAHLPQATLKPQCDVGTDVRKLLLNELGGRTSAITKDGRASESTERQSASFET